MKILRNEDFAKNPAARTFADSRFTLQSLRNKDFASFTGFRTFKLGYTFKRGTPQAMVYRKRTIMKKQYCTDFRS
jgi:hypothetical protein